jgi:hypothetical protein
MKKHIAILFVLTSCGYEKPLSPDEIGVFIQEANLECGSIAKPSVIHEECLKKSTGKKAEKLPKQKAVLDEMYDRNIEAAKLYERKKLSKDQFLQKRQEISAIAGSKLNIIHEEMEGITQGLQSMSGATANWSQQQGEFYQQKALTPVPQAQTQRSPITCRTHNYGNSSNTTCQ